MLNIKAHNEEKEIHQIEITIDELAKTSVGDIFSATVPNSSYEEDLEVLFKDSYGVLVRKWHFHTDTLGYFHVGPCETMWISHK